MTELLEKLKAALSDRYDVERELGQGGMATVFLARDVRHERKVAVKVLHEDLGAALGAERFRREIQIATSLTHPHILTLYDSGEAADSLFYVMPFIEGESLRQRIDREKMLPIDQALKITQEVASALDYAHRKGVVHRDIKPENILLEDGHAIVADFGIARAVSTMGDSGGALTKTGMSLGTPTYMSPEQAFAEKEIDGRADMYSLACVLYEMLTGQPPFTGSNAQAVMARHSMAEVPSMQIVRATIPDEVEDVVQRALAKSPADRFATVAEFAEELQECVIDYHTTTRRAVTDRRTAARVPPGRRATDAGPTPVWRRKQAIVGAALAFVAILGGSGWWIWGRGASASAAGALAANKVAVMYFQDVNPNGELGYLAEGLTEHLIARLDEVQGLQVISEGGVAQFRGTDVSVDSIATLLGVGTIVRGTVQQLQDKVRIKVNLLDGNTGDVTASQEFEQPGSNIVAAQDSLAERVATLLRRRVGLAIEIQQARAGTSNTAAWTLFQRAQKLRRDATSQVERGDAVGAAQSFAQADSLLTQAAALDANWAEPIVARSAISLTRARAAESALEAAPWIEKGLQDAGVVLSRNPRNAGALEMRGSLLYLNWAYNAQATNRAERDALLQGAERDLSAAVEIDPTRASAWNSLSTVHSQKGETSQAKIAAQRAYEGDAYLSGTEGVLWKLYATSYDQRQFNDAVKYCDDGARRFPADPRFIRCKLWLQTVNGVTADPSRAWLEYAKISSPTPPADWSPQDWRLLQAEAKMLVAASLGRDGKVDSARKVILSARPDPDLDKEGELSGVEAFIRTLFGTAADTTEALNILNRYASGSPQHREGLARSELWWWQGLKSDPRFPR